MSEIEKNSAILLDLGGVTFKDNPNPNDNYKYIINLFNGKDLEETARVLNLEIYLEEIKSWKKYQDKDQKSAGFFAGDVLIDKLFETGQLNRDILLSARIEAVRMRDERIISAIKEQFPFINIAIATKDLPIVHGVVKHYLPEIADRLQIVTSDEDIKADKTTSDFYYNASSRLYIPTTNMALVDDLEANIKGIESVGGTGSVFNPNDDNSSLSDTVLGAIESNLRK